MWISPWFLQVGFNFPLVLIRFFFRTFKQASLLITSCIFSHFSVNSSFLSLLLLPLNDVLYFTWFCKLVVLSDALTPSPVSGLIR